MLRHPTPHVSLRSAFYCLTNIDEHPEALSFSRGVVTRGIEDATYRIAHSCEYGMLRSDAESLPDLVRYLDDNRITDVFWRHAGDTDTGAALTRHLLTQFAPTAMLDGCWLQNVMRAALAASPTGARLATIYAGHVHAFHDGTSFTSEYLALHRRVAFSLPGITSRSFADHPAFDDSSFDLPILLLCIGQYPQSCLPELLGLHLGWHTLGLSAVGPTLIQRTRLAHKLPESPMHGNYMAHAAAARKRAIEAAEQTLAECPGDESSKFLARIRIGAQMVTTHWNAWVDRAKNSNVIHGSSTKQAMIAMLHQKRPHAIGYHRDKLIDGVRIDSLMAADNFCPDEILQRLAKSRFIVPGRPDDSPFFTELVVWGGPMHSVFSPAELDTIRAWIFTLPGGDEAEPGTSTAHDTVAAGLQPGRGTEPLMHTRSEYVRRARMDHGKCSIREMYHRLINIEHYPEILPRAEAFARNRLTRSMAALNSRARPIPSRHYSPEILDHWVAGKHREQMNEYDPRHGKPLVTKEAFIHHSVQLAPLILIDGAWLQGMLTLKSSPVELDRILFQILYEESGEGDSRKHHANIYRDLLYAMGTQPPAIETKEFIHWPPLHDSSFEMPVFWLSIAAFPRHFMPEILGLNLAVELAGVGGPYMQARDTLRYFNLPTLFVDVHLAADNVSQGHTASSVHAIKLYMDHVSDRDGPYGLDSTWRRVWSGVRSTLPQMGVGQLFAHRVCRRLRGTKLEEPARIFAD